MRCADALKTRRCLRIRQFQDVDLDTYDLGRYQCHGPHLDEFPDAGRALKPSYGFKQHFHLQLGLDILRIGREMDELLLQFTRLGDWVLVLILSKYLEYENSQ